jgi:thymidylate synthase (FAD)
MDEKAQYEIRSYAKIIGYEIVYRWCPIAWEAFLDYSWGALTLSKKENEIIREISSGNSNKAIELARQYGWISYEGGKIKKHLERMEMDEKLRRLNLTIPWESKTV